MPDASEKYRIECSRCHRMIMVKLPKRPDELYKRTFTCSGCCFELIREGQSA
jgi:hypothetical protein